MNFVKKINKRNKFRTNASFMIWNRLLVTIYLNFIENFREP